MKPILIITFICALISMACAPLANADEFFIRFNDDMDALVQEQWLDGRGIRVIKRFELTDAILCETVDQRIAQLSSLEADASIRYAQLNGSFEMVGVPNDERFSQQWSLQNTGQTGGTPGADISAVEAWDLIGGASEVLVGIIDTGIDYDHPDLINRMWDGGPEYPNHGYDFGENDNEPMPQHFHGTHVGGIVGAETENAIGIAGIAPNIRLMAVKASSDIDDRFSWSDVVDALEFCAAQGADVINASFGSLLSNQPSAIEEVLQGLDSLGVVFVAAAGNDSENLENNLLFYPACFDVPNVISVAATDMFDELAMYSNYGVTQTDLGAPGTNIYSTTLNGAYTYASGTSMAAPHVTGAVAVLLGLYPDLTPAEVRTVLMESVTPLTSLSRIVASGGRLDMLGMLSYMDEIAPGEVTDLAMSNVYASKICLAWTAVGDDGYSRTAYRNDLRYSLAPITDENDFAAATIVNDLDTPREPGLLENECVEGLAPATTYYFGLRVGDRGGNWSPIATVSATTEDVTLAILDETPLSFTAHTGLKSVTSLVLENGGSGMLSYLARAVSVGMGRSVPGTRQALAPMVPYLQEAPARSSGHGKVGPTGASGFQTLSRGLNLNTAGDFQAFARSGGSRSAEWGAQYYDDFENDLGFWTAEVIAGSNLWHYSTFAYNSPVQSLAFVDPITGTYDTGTALDVAMVSDVIDLQTAEGDVVLEFYEWYSTELGYDFCNVEVSSDGGQNWIPVRNGISGDSEGWRLTSLDLTAFVGEQINVRFRFHTDDALFNDHPGWYLDDVSIRDDGASWVHFYIGTGVVPAYSSRNIQFQIDAEGLCDGQYNADIQVYTNDPTHPMFTVPVDLTVTSAADIYYETNGLDMGMPYVGYPETRTFALSNVGCETMEISGLASTSPEFSVSLSTTSIAPGEVADLTVVFAPTLAVPTYALVTFMTNDPDEVFVSLIAYGTGQLAPQIVLSETAFSEPVSGQTVVPYPLEIRNDGAGDLHWQFAPGFDVAGEPVGQSRVLFDCDNYGHNHLFYISVCDAGYTTATLEELDPENMFFTQEYLDAADVVVIYGERDYTNTEIDLLTDWVDGGGGLMFVSPMTHRESIINELLTALGTGIQIVDGPGGVESMTPMTNHSLAEGVESMWANHHRNLGGVDLPMRLFARSSQGHDLQAFGVIGTGRVFLSAATFTWMSRIGEADNMALASNVVAWLAGGVPTMEPSAGTLAPGTSQVVDVLFDSTDKLTGTWDYDCFVASNDPATPVVTVSASYEVTGASEVYLAQDEYHMGLVYAAEDTSIVVEVVNTGNGQLTISDITSTNARFVFDETSMLLEPWERLELTVTLLAGIEGFIATEVTIFSDAPGQSEVTLIVDASSQLPHIVTSTMEIPLVELVTGEDTYRTFDLTNSGLWPLEYNFVSSDPTHFFLNDPSGIIEPGATGVINVTFFAGMDCGLGTLQTILSIESNDNTPDEEICASIAITDMQHIDLVYQTTQMGHMVGAPRGDSEQVRINNEGCEDLTITGITLEGDHFSLSNIQTGVVAPGEGFTFIVVFNSPEAGEFIGVLTVSSDDPLRPEWVVNFHGEAIEYRSTDVEEIVVLDDQSLSNSPNPFNSSTNLSFYAPQAGIAAVRIYDTSGRLVKRLDAGSVCAGRSSVTWNGQSGRGSTLDNGVYFYQLYIDGREIGRMSRAILLK